VTIPKFYNETWEKERESLAEQDPMFDAALQIKPSIFTEDVKTASPKVLNRNFEENTLVIGHSFMLIYVNTASYGEFYNPAFLITLETGLN
jgi:hypothetical protein